MGHCPCFGRRKKGIISRIDGDEDHEPEHNNVRISIQSSGSHIIEHKIEEKLDKTVLKEDSSQPKRKAKIFSYIELATATNNFMQESYIGEGGFGAVYKGRLKSMGQVLAVKQLNHSGLQGNKEFLVEVLMLALLRHPNLVNLIGYCAEGDQRLLVYEFMPMGSLEDHLYDLKPGMQPLDWNTRMKIAAGAANGLNFLHNEADPPVIYRDLKSSNILLDEWFHPKLSDFGLAKFGPPKDKTHVSTRVMGTHGYCAPEYAGTGRLTTKSDIYSFGVVLLELITGRRPLDMDRENGKYTLVDWARPMLKDRDNLIAIADPLLKGQFSEHSLRKAVELASICVREEAQSRPGMKDVMLAMNYLASKKYDPKKDQRRVGSSPEGDGQIHKGLENLNDNLEEIRLMNKMQERQRAVAEAKMWGETWREKMAAAAGE